MKYSSVCIFIPTGRTFTFRDVEMVTDNETVLVLRYKAMSDSLIKTVTIQKSAIVGWSTFSAGPVQLIPG